MHNIDSSKKCIYTQWWVNVFRHSPISVGSSPTDDPPWLLCTLPYIQTRTERIINIYYTNTCFGGEEWVFTKGTTQKRTEFSLVFNLLHDTSDCCYQSHWDKLNDTKHEKGKTIDTQVTLYVLNNFQWLEPEEGEVCVCVWWGRRCPFGVRARRRPLLLLWDLLSRLKFYYFIAGRFISVFV